MLRSHVPLLGAAAALALCLATTSCAAPSNYEQAQATAQKYIHPAKIGVVAVGDRSKIEDEMKKLNLGKIEIRDPEGKIVQ